ncbi:MAG: hypothetical protein HQ582_33800 [Planctomycetes bacterium]|nr:hypothetical protein [Planctomycetota bacterium]
MMAFAACSLHMLAPIDVLPSALGDLPTVVDEQYKNACGPVACFVALRSLGVETSLDDVVERCKWEEGKFISLETLEAAVQSYRGIDGHLAQVSPPELCQLLGDDQTVVILVTRKRSEELNHAVCAVAVTDNDQTIRLIDYPELTQERLIAELADAWDGQALVVRRSATYRALDKVGLFFAPMVAFLIGVFWVCRRREGGTASASESGG